MFTIQEIEQAHDKVKTGADFPKYIQEIKQLGVLSFETWVIDSHTEYFGKDDFKTKSAPHYEDLTISETVDKETFVSRLKAHQQGKTDYPTFCKDCAQTGVEKWIMDLDKMTCTYFDKKGNEILAEKIPE